MKQDRSSSSSDSTRSATRRVCSRSVVALAQFRDFGNVVGAVIGTFSLPDEPLGPSSRRTQLAFSEIMYTPAPRTDNLNTEYLEIYNSNPWWDDLSGYQLAGPGQQSCGNNTRGKISGNSI